jgi:hypothetical protein
MILLIPNITIKPAIEDALQILILYHWVCIAQVGNAVHLTSIQPLYDR